MKKKVPSAKSVTAAKVTVKTLYAEVESARKNLVRVMKEPNLSPKTNDYIEAWKDLVQNKIDWLDARLHLVEKISEVLSEGMLSLFPEEPK